MGRLALIQCLGRGAVGKSLKQLGSGTLLLTLATAAAAADSGSWTPSGNGSTLRIRSVESEKTTTPVIKLDANPRPQTAAVPATEPTPVRTITDNQVAPVSAVVPLSADQDDSIQRTGGPNSIKRNEPTLAKPPAQMPGKINRESTTASSRRSQMFELAPPPGVLHEATRTPAEPDRHGATDIAKKLESVPQDSEVPHTFSTETDNGRTDSPLFVAERGELYAADGMPPPPAASGPTPMLNSPFEVIDETDSMTIMLRRNRILRSKVNISRTAVVDPSICNVIQFTPREVSIIGLGQGATHVTFWFEGDERPITYLVKVVPDPEVQARRESQYKLFEEVLAELFPDSKVHLQPIADKLLVRGEAKDSEEAAQIMAVIRGEAVRGGNRGDAGYGSLVDGLAANPIAGEDRDRRLPATQIINLLRVPGEQQVALRVKIAELDRSAARSFGVDLNSEITIGNGALLLQSMLSAAAGAGPSIIARGDGDKINFGIHFLEAHGVVRVLSEPTLVTMSGRAATFHAGGEFAVPTTVGVQGVAAVTTEFRSFGAIISFLPVVVDKDRIRLEVSPEFSKINNSLTVGDTPGLDTRAVTTTVEMREGQTLAIAGLLDDAMKNDRAGDIPFVTHLFGLRNATRTETELIILVTPELVHPLDPEEVPPLPGFDVTEPTHDEFYYKGQLEGRPTHETRSTVWPILRKRYQNGGQTMMSGPFGHGQ